MSAAAVCQRCGRELVGLPSACPACSTPDPGRTPAAGYSHAQGLLEAAERGERARAESAARNGRAEAAARELLLASLDRVVELLPTSHSWGRFSGGVPPSCSILNPHRGAVARRRAHLDALSGAAGDSPYTDLDSDVRDRWA